MLWFLRRFSLGILGGLYFMTTYLCALAFKVFSLGVVEEALYKDNVRETRGAIRK